MEAIYRVISGSPASHVNMNVLLPSCVKERYSSREIQQTLTTFESIHREFQPRTTLQGWRRGEDDMEWSTFYK
jgi:hypothetical protein